MNLLSALVVVLLPAHVPAIINDAVLETRAHCEARFERRLAGNSNGRRSTNAISSHGYRDLVDLSGFAVHQPLRSAPFDVYVTEMRIRVPEHSQWIGCRADDVGTAFAVGFWSKELSAVVWLFDAFLVQMLTLTMTYMVTTSTALQTVCEKKPLHRRDKGRS